MKNKIMKIIEIGTRALPFVIAIAEFVGWIKTRDSGMLNEFCLWGVIGCLENRVAILKEKVDGSIH